MILSRREFLRLSGLALGAAALPPIPPDEAPLRAQFLGRAILTNVIYDRPSLTAPQLGVLPSETIFSVYGAVVGEDEHYNRTWYRVQRGYVYSGFVQPVRWQLQTPSLDVPSRGFVGEISVPYTIAKAGPQVIYESVYRFYYGTTHWVTDALIDSASDIWYKVLDDRLQKHYWVKGTHVRRVTPEEVAPISPSVKNKRIEIDLERQILRCFEGDVNVLETLCATGPYLRTEYGQRIFGTPSGEWAINRKRPSRHMAGGDLAADDTYDLPGVPWVSYFHWWGVSFHGTYWHNDYGRPRSHGCVNLSPADAKWVFRWTLPRSPLSRYETEGDGTQVIVF